MKAVSYFDILPYPYWHTGSNSPVFTFLPMSPSLDSKSQINLKCLPLHKSQAQLLPFLPPSPQKHSEPRAADFLITVGTRWDRDLPEAQLSIWICNELQYDLSMRPQYGESPRLLPSRFTSAPQLASSLTISFKVKSSRMPTVTAPYGDLRN